jgi:peptide/nickel transport system ATP-binding protein
LSPLLIVKELRVYYELKSSVIRAVDGVSFDLEPGEALGLVGESGSGKSTLALAIARLLRRPARVVSGSIIFEGRDLLSLDEQEMRTIRGRRIGYVFQDPFTSLDPLERVGDQLVEALRAHEQLREHEARERALQLLEDVGLTRDRFSDYPHQLSGGQRQRVAIALAIAHAPPLVIADEPTTALDVLVQEKIMELLMSLKGRGSSLMLITHDLALASQRCERLAVMYAGEVVELGPSRRMAAKPLHPYTMGLLDSLPDPWSETEPRPLQGSPPDLSSPPTGCRFHPRCPFAMELCRRSPPPAKLREGALVRCWLYAEDEESGRAD